MPSPRPYAKSPPSIARIAEDMTSGFTIGQAAAFAGVTVKAVRRHHRLGSARRYDARVENADEHATTAVNQPP